MDKKRVTYIKLLLAFQMNLFACAWQTAITQIDFYIITTALIAQPFVSN